MGDLAVSAHQAIIVMKLREKRLMGGRHGLIRMLRNDPQSLWKLYFNLAPAEMETLSAASCLRETEPRLHLAPVLLRAIKSNGTLNLQSASQH